MAKRVKAGDLDESLIIQSFKDIELLANPTDAIVQKENSSSPSADATQKEIAQKEPTKENILPLPETGSKTKSKRRKGSYNETFLARKELKSRQPVYISQEIHQSITRLVHLLALANKEISVGGYIDNVLREHMEQNRDEIADLYRTQIDEFYNH